MKLLPAHMRQYQAFDYVQKMVKGYLKVSGLVYQVPVTETLDFFFFFFFLFTVITYGVKHLHGFSHPDFQCILKKIADAM